MNWFEVDRSGLAKLIDRKGKAFVIYELLQNAWDSGAQNVSVEFQPVPGRPACSLLVIDDDPQGFSNLSHAYTLFAESEKKVDPTKRGRFNLGEKLVLALCDWAEIVTTSGGVRFDDKGRHTLRRRVNRGSVFCGQVRMTRAEFDEVLLDVQKLIPPKGVNTKINGRNLTQRAVIKTVDVELPTEISDEEGVLRRTAPRKTTMRLFSPADGEQARLYEIGIPVVELDCPFHVDIAQKIPLNMERDGVPPAYLRAIRTLVLNATANDLLETQVTASWIDEALGDKRIEDAAVRLVMEKRFGVRRVSYDPSDVEGSKIAVERGYTVVHGGSLSGDAWENVRRAGAILPAGQITPSPKPFHPDGKPLKILEESLWDLETRSVVEYAKRIASELIGVYLNVVIANDREWHFYGAYGNASLIINRARLGQSWFAYDRLEDINRFLIHEFSHHFSEDHLSNDYHDAQSKLGAKLTSLALANPGLFLNKKVLA